MGNYFKPWRRKIGVLTLVMSCVFMGGWVRSLVVKDEINLINFRGLYCHIRSEVGDFECIWCNARIPIYLPFTWTAEAIDSSSQTNNSARMWFTRVYPEMRFGPDTGKMGDGFRIQYWALVIPLTMLSTYLLLSKPRPARKPFTSK
jgi:hypothetical protein